ncbi:MAG: hypothetical protein ABI183_13835 [Polyangiaceae bacterium]
MPPRARLEQGLTVEHIADACRSAAVAFVDGVGAGWEKEELARWLLGPYHQLSMLRLSHESMRSPVVSGVFPRSNPGGIVVNDDVVRVMWTAREEVLNVIDAFAQGTPNAESFVWKLQAHEVFARIEDCNGDRGFVPNEAVSQHLSERVLSLVAADYVVRPFDYEDHVAVCQNCGVMTFGPNARADRDCGLHRSPSGIRPRIEFHEMNLDDADVDDAEVFRLVSKM